MPQQIRMPKRKMQSLRTLYKVGFGPSSSHTYGTGKNMLSIYKETSSGGLAAIYRPMVLDDE